MATPSERPICQSCGRRDTPHEIVLPGAQVFMTSGCLCTAPAAAHDHWESIGCKPLPRLGGEAFMKLGDPVFQLADQMHQRRLLSAELSEAALEGRLAEAISKLNDQQLRLIADLLPPEMIPPTPEGEDVG